MGDREWSLLNPAATCNSKVDVASKKKKKNDIQLEANNIMWFCCQVTYFLIKFCMNTLHRRSGKTETRMEGNPEGKNLLVNYYFASLPKEKETSSHESSGSGPHHSWERHSPSFGESTLGSSTHRCQSMKAQLSKRLVDDPTVDSLARRKIHPLSESSSPGCEGRKGSCGTGDAPVISHQFWFARPETVKPHLKAFFLLLALWDLLPGFPFRGVRTAGRSQFPLILLRRINIGRFLAPEVVACLGRGKSLNPSLAFGDFERYRSLPSLLDPVWSRTHRSISLLYFSLSLFCLCP